MSERTDDKINRELNKLAQERWKQITEDTDLASLPLSTDQFAFLRVYFQLGFDQGYADALKQVEEIYHEDVDLFQKMFEEDILN